MNKTPLYDLHVEAGGQIVDFAGWLLPIRFQGLIEEHKACRETAAMFDVSHMGEIFVSGDDAEKFINYVCCNDVRKIVDGQAQYTAFLNQKGGVVDDLIVYRFHPNKYLLCVNASNSDQDFRWLLEQKADYNVEILNKSPEFGQIALQGPRAEDCFAEIIPEIRELKYFHFTEAYYKDSPIIIARTGYTGEDGFEIFIPWDATPTLWEDLLSKGAPHGLTLAGLGARDTLRLEASYPLHGHELRADIPALSSGLGWIVKFDKDDFIGKSALAELKESADYDRLIGFELMDPGIVREKTYLYSPDNEKIGEVCSGTKTPTVNKAIGMAHVNSAYSKVDQELTAEVRNKKIRVKVVKLPFYKRNT